MAKILQVHNEYLHLGGEDIVVRNEFELLVSKGHDVRQFTVRNQDVDTTSVPGRIRLAANAIWSRRYEEDITRLLEEFKPDVAHVHNTFPLLSPAVFRVLHKSGCRVVATLHNSRLICANATFVRNGELCTKCLTGSKMNAIWYGCYRDSRLGSSTVVFSTALHTMLGTFSKNIDCFVANTQLSKDQFVQAGLPEDRIFVKYNFVPKPPEGMATKERKKRFVFAGRLSQEKGLGELLEAWSTVDSTGWELAVVGEGPLGDELRGKYSEIKSIKWLDRLPRPQLLELFACSRWLAFPSACFEQSPLVPVEAMSVGTPIIVRDLGSLPDIVRPEGSGLVFDSSSENGLAVNLKRAMQMEDCDWQTASVLAQGKATGVFSPEACYGLLKKIYGIEGE